MKKSLIFPQIVIFSLMLISCGGSDDSSNDTTLKIVSDIESVSEIVGVWDTSDELFGENYHYISANGDVTAIYWRDEEDNMVNPNPNADVDCYEFYRNAYSITLISGSTFQYTDTVSTNPSSTATLGFNNTGDVIITLLTGDMFIEMSNIGEAKIIEATNFTLSELEAKECTN